jgi:hypothetical protein
MDKAKTAAAVTRVLRGIAFGLVMLVLYVLSIGPATRICTMGVSLKPWYTMLNTVYWPVARGALVLGVADWLESYCRLWVPIEEIQAKASAGLPSSDSRR